MSIAFLDSSVILAIEFREYRGAELEKRLRSFSELRASNLLEAEVRAAYVRERRRFNPEVLDGINWVTPERPLSREISTVVEAGYVRGADLWHLATALYMATDPREVVFITLDERQGEVASSMGFRG